MNFIESYISLLLISGVSLSLWVIGLIFLWKSASGSRLTRRIVFLTIALVGLGLLLAKPLNVIELEPANVLINTSRNSTDKKTPSMESGIVYSFENVHEFLNSNVANRTLDIDISGLGLSREDLDLIKEYRLNYQPEMLHSGISSIQVPIITEGKNWTIDGVIQGDSVSAIYLENPDQSKSWASISDSTFSVNAAGNVAGSYLIPVITLLSSGDTLQDVLPLEVEKETNWQLLILASFPSFEINYLKNYWTSLGNGFALRTKISSQKYNSTFINSRKINLDILSQKALSDFNFIIADSKSWNELSTQEQSNIKNAVYNKGLTLIVKPLIDSKTTSYLSLPPWDEPKDIQWKTSLEEVTLSHYYLQSNWRSVSQQGHVLAKYKSSGLGHIALLGIEDSYKLILSDCVAEYQNLWAEIFSNLLREFKGQARSLYNTWFWENEKSKISILSNSELIIPPVLNDTMELPYLNVPFIKGVFETTFWPVSGYNEILLNEGEESVIIYAHPRDTWKAMRQAEYLEINAKAAKRSQELQDRTFTQTKPYLIYWWFIMSIIGFGMLWLDERIYN